MELTYIVHDASSFDTPDGFIAIGAISGGTPPYSLLWENGDTLFYRQNLLAGNYSVTFTDANGCVFSQDFTVSAPSATSGQTPVMPDLSIWPNPNNGKFLVRLESGAEQRYGLKVLDLMGNTLLHIGNWPGGGTVREIPLDIQQLPDGLYLLELYWDIGRVVQPFVKQE